MRLPKLDTIKELEEIYEIYKDGIIDIDNISLDFLLIHGRKIREVVNNHIPKQRPEMFLYTVYRLAHFVTLPWEYHKSRSKVEKYYHLCRQGSLLKRLQLIAEEEYLIKMLKIDTELLNAKIRHYKEMYNFFSEKAGNKIGWEHIIDDIVYMLKKMSIEPKYQIAFFFDLFTVLEYDGYGKGIYQKQQKDRIRKYLDKASPPRFADLLN